MSQNFLTEYMAENFRTGQEQEPDENNKVTKERKRIKKQLHATAAKKGQTLEEVSLEFVQSNRPEIERYVVTQNETPHENTAELATQAYLLRQAQIDTVAGTMGLDRDKAEIFLESAEASAIEQEHPDADNFLGGLLEGVGPVASKGLNILANKHAKTHGGKRGIAGFFADVLGGGDKQQDDNGKSDPSQDAAYSAKILAKEVIDKVVDNKKKEVVKQNIPLIIGIVLGVIILTVLITKSAK